MSRYHAVGLLALWAGQALAQPMQCDLFTSDGAPAAIPFVHFVLDQPNRRAVARNGTVFALEVEERRYRLSRRAEDGKTFALLVDRDTGQGAWAILGAQPAIAGLLRCYRAPPRL